MNDKESSKIKLSAAKKAQVEKYKCLTLPIKQLTHEFSLCEEILESMEHILYKFQENIAKVNLEIETLQQRSNDMKIELSNRNDTELQLSRVLKNLVVLPDMLLLICDGEIDEIFVNNIDLFKNKLTYIQKYEKTKDFKAISELKPVFDLLRLKASSRIRNYLLDNIKEIRKLDLDINYFHNTCLIKYKTLNHFLIEKHPEAAIEVCDNYINTTRQYYYDNFLYYKNGLVQAITGVVDKEIKFGSSNDNKISSLFWSTKAVSNSGINNFFNSTGVNVENNYFSLGNRNNIIFDLDKNHIFLKNIQDSQQKIYMEEIFYNFNLALVENSICEYDFVEKFFVTTSHSAKKTNDGSSVEREMINTIFGHILEPVLDLGIDLAKKIIATSFDAIGILLCIRSIPNLVLIRQNRQIQALDTYFNSLNISLWPRFQHLIDLHSNRLLKLSDLSFKNYKFDSYPHQVTRQYAEFISAILRLNCKFDSPALITGLARLRTSMQKFLKNYSTMGTDSQLELLFLVNNYDQILFILKDNTVNPEESEYRYWQNRMNEAVYGICEEFMNVHFGYIKQYMMKVGAHSIQQSISKDEAIQVVVQFNMEWRKEILNINTSVVPKFSNFITGTAIVHDLLKQLIIVYTKFITHYEENFRASLQGSDTIEPVGVHNVMLEIKKYRPVF
ncbi:hypothetical protein BB561_001108 [Smittium simulii]|uniref:Vacuolar protein sorting-associated protein 52 homolog n=1 Tax=Smittium simulii TaxID=133385 RepID=A0A2T9YW20_9FUNG|nr:hypothetical protein BB561_001108 [Smittium simulii]